MAKLKTKSVFVCQQCGKESFKWLGRCPVCQEWNSLVETVVSVSARDSSSWLYTKDNIPKELAGLKAEKFPRLVFSMTELNRVLGGGSVLGSVVLIGGDPGIGKSTLLLQVSAAVADSGARVIYVSGEESSQQLGLRAERLGLSGHGLYILTETNIEVILGRLNEMLPSLVAIDSIQTIYLEELSNAPGSIGQIRECTVRLMRWAKQANIPVFITGHVTKEGAIAGPKVLEHIVDVVLYIEGETFSSYRILRSAKNRFGSTNEVGVFEMSAQGLIEVTNPSEVFVTSHHNGAIGSVVVSTFEGSRSLLVEIQALTSLASFGPPRRIATGVDFSRLLLIAAVLTRRAGVNLSNQDVITNVIGGLKISEPAADLGIALATASSFKDLQVLPKLVAIGEIGLSGELRSVPNLDRRIAEAARLGFKSCLVPRSSYKLSPQSKNMEIIKADTVYEALRKGLVKPLKESDLKI